MLSTDKQTEKQTYKLTNATKNITSFAKEAINTYITKMRLKNERDFFLFHFILIRCM